VLKTNKPINNVNFECLEILGTNARTFFLFAFAERAPPTKRKNKEETDKKGILEP
jgi:hypothetical protein